MPISFFPLAHVSGFGWVGFFVRLTIADPRLARSQVSGKRTRRRRLA
jgi:hypothetical protein